MIFFNFIQAKLVLFKLFNTNLLLMHCNLLNGLFNAPIR